MELRLKHLKSYLPKINILSQQLFNKFRLALGECELCKGNDLQHPMLCKYCHKELPYFNLSLLNYNLLQWPAIDKLFPKKSFDELFCLSPYIWPFDIWIKQLKYQNRFDLADLLGHLLFENWKNSPNYTQGKTQHKAQNYVVLSVPIHLSKWQQRGYNQAHLIAKVFAKKSGVPYLDTFLSRTGLSESQVGKTGKQRRKKLSNDFQLTLNDFPLPSSLPAKVILIDDVITTGTTVNAICHKLKKAGVQKIIVMTIALTLPKST